MSSTKVQPALVTGIYSPQKHTPEDPTTWHPGEVPEQMHPPKLPCSRCNSDRWVLSLNVLFQMQIRVFILQTFQAMKALGPSLSVKHLQNPGVSELRPVYVDTRGRCRAAGMGMALPLTPLSH